MSITIIKAGLHDAFQDAGRYGYRHMGINPGGAMDRYAMQLANVLVGNNPGEAVLEVHFPAAAILFNTDALITLTGADFSPTLDGETIPSWQPLLVKKNALLHFGKRMYGARTCLAIAGGFNLQTWLGSYTTNLQAGMGGYQGRLLKKGDVVNFKNEIVNLHITGKCHQLLHWHISPPDYDNKLGVIPGKHWGALPVKAQQDFESNEFTITGKTNRMGYRLSGPPMQVSTREQVSTALNFGTIQSLPDGQLIILGADHQATGGYPVIGHVITAHHSKLAQLAAGEKIVFELVTHQNALTLLNEQQQYLKQLQNAVGFKLPGILK